MGSPLQCCVECSMLLLPKQDVLLTWLLAAMRANNLTCMCYSFRVLPSIPIDHYCCYVCIQLGSVFCDDNTHLTGWAWQLHLMQLEQKFTNNAWPSQCFKLWTRTHSSDSICSAVCHAMLCPPSPVLIMPHKVFFPNFKDSLSNDMQLKPQDST